MDDIQLKTNEAVKAAKREYMRQWRKANPDKVQAAQNRYWLRKGVELRNMKQAATHPDNTEIKEERI